MQMLHLQSNWSLCQSNWSLCLTLFGLLQDQFTSTPFYTPVGSCLSQQRHCAAPEEARKFWPGQLLPSQQECLDLPIWPLSSGLGQSCSEDRTFFFPRAIWSDWDALTVDLGCVVLNLANLGCSFWAGENFGHCRSPELNTADTGPESSWYGA